MNLPAFNYPMQSASVDPRLITDPVIVKVARGLRERKLRSVKLTAIPPDFLTVEAEATTGEKRDIPVSALRSVMLMDEQTANAHAQDVQAARSFGTPMHLLMSGAIEEITLVRRRFLWFESMTCSFRFGPHRVQASSRYLPVAISQCIHKARPALQAVLARPGR